VYKAAEGEGNCSHPGEPACGDVPINPCAEMGDSPIRKFVLKLFWLCGLGTAYGLSGLKGMPFGYVSGAERGAEPAGIIGW